MINRKNLLALMLISALTLPIFVAKAQNGDIEKQFAKADKLVENNKAEAAEKVLKSLAEKYPADGKVWDKLIQTQLAVYPSKQKGDNLFANMTITTKDKDGNIIQNDSTSQKLLELLSQIKPSDAYLQHIINTCRIASCQTRNALSASMIIRMYRIDKETKSADKEARIQFNKAESEFQKKNYSSASAYYQKAIELDSSFYKARLYLGDVYFFTRHYDLAIDQFKKAIASRPDLLEPRKYLIDALDETHEFQRAYDVCIDALSIYPDFVLGYRLEEAAYQAGIKCKLNWIPREVLPNATKKQEVEKEDITIPMPKNSPWSNYTAALGKVKGYCNEKGILADNPLTKQKYLEVYSWEQMLEKSTDPRFDFARKMKDKGFLDCYVLVSCFHYDIYDQYRDLVASNPGRIKEYIELLKSEQ